MESGDNLNSHPNEHPTKSIIGDEGDKLQGINVALCITGSVAATRCPDIARTLMRQGAEVRVAMSKKATDLITPELMHWASGNPVIDDLTGRVEHVDLGQWADIVLVAPATANSIGKMASGIGDTPPTALVSVVRGLDKPTVIVPAMHESMYKQDITGNNVSKLEDLGMHFLEPNYEEGKAKLPSVDQIVEFVIGLTRPKDLSGLSVLVTAGPTYEEVDPVRVLTNRSSGKMGIETAKAAAIRGAEVTLIYGPGTEEPPASVRTVHVKTTEDMLNAVEEELDEKKYDLMVAAAAPQDFKPEEFSNEKLRRDEKISLDLVPTDSILERAGEVSPETYRIGFKAECGVSDDELETASKMEMEKYGLDMVVGNDVARSGAGFNTDTNDVLILSGTDKLQIKGSKFEIANSILDIFTEEYRG